MAGNPGKSTSNLNRYCSPSWPGQFSFTNSSLITQLPFASGKVGETALPARRGVATFRVDITVTVTVPFTVSWEQTLLKTSWSCNCRFFTSCRLVARVWFETVAVGGWLWGTRRHGIAGWTSTAYYEIKKSKPLYLLCDGLLPFDWANNKKQT